ncbi:hypothetical protein Q7P37_006357 [Cladosporium fusiforme]
MDSLPPPTTMPTAQHTALSASSNPQSRIPSTPDLVSASPAAAPSPSASPSPTSEAEDDDDMPLPTPTIITADTIPHLTDLLNRPGVRHNEQKRAWVQAKLMDAQLELKRQRRGRRQRSSLPLGGEL